MKENADNAWKRKPARDGARSVIGFETRRQIRTREEIPREGAESDVYVESVTRNTAFFPIIVLCVEGVEERACHEIGRPDEGSGPYKEAPTNSREGEASQLRGQQKEEGEADRGGMSFRLTNGKPRLTRVQVCNRSNVPKRQ